MALRVTRTTDGKWIGLVLPIDPLDPPAQIPVADSLFDPFSWEYLGNGKWRVWNWNYIVFCEEA